MFLASSVFLLPLAQAGAQKTLSAVQFEMAWEIQVQVDMELELYIEMKR